MLHSIATRSRFPEQDIFRVHIAVIEAQKTVIVIAFNNWYLVTSIAPESTAQGVKPWCTKLSRH